jgi:hypothetical protein
MHFYFFRIASIVVFLFSSFALLAQKPMPDRPIAFGELTQKAYDIEGWNRVDATTGAVQVMYKNFYRPIAGTPEVMARDFLNFSKDELALTPADLGNLEMHGTRSRRVGTTVRFHQQWKGIPVHGAEVSMTIKPNRSVVMVNNSFVNNLDLRDVTPSLSAGQARTIALDYLNTEGRITDEFNDLKIVATNNGAKLAYRISLVAMEPLGEWEVFVDAKNGEILRVTDIAAYHKHRTEPEPAYVPFPAIMVQGTGNIWVPDPLSSAGADYGDTGFSDNNDANSPELLAQQVSVALLDITLEGGMYFLKGPWAEITDEEAPNRGVFEQATNVWDFDRTDNAFEAVNVYYHIDESMRYLNEELGIDVRPSLYPGGVKCDPSGLNDADNSHYVGGSQRLSWGDGGVDDAEDSDVVHHELGHGLHDWITMGGLSQNQGLSEGSGDYWAASYNRSLGDWTPADEQYFWIFNWDGHNPFWNGRSCGVSTTWQPSLGGGIHTQGQVWSTSMMLVYDAIGKRKTDIIFWEGLALTNGNSNQNDAANAVYEAARAIPACTAAELMSIHTILTNRGYQLPPFELPVEWLSFDATPTDKEVALDWATASESGNDYYEVERSTNEGRTFSAIGRVAAAGESIDARSYNFIDESPITGRNTYRVRQVDVDGSFSYSDIITIAFGGSSTVAALAPNPTNGLLSLRRVAFSDEPFTVRVMDLNGREVLRREAVTDGMPFSVAALPTGVYLLRYLEGKEMTSVRFVRK